MKLSRLLKPIGLYEPGKRAETLLIQTARRVKSIVYYRRLKKHRKKYAFSRIRSNILIAANGGIGNAVEATPFIQAVRMFWPQSNITLLTSAGDLFENWCVPDRIVHSVDQIKGETFDQTFLTYSAHWGSPDWLKDLGTGTIHRPRQYFDEVCLKPEAQYNMDMLRRMGFKGPAPALYVSVKEKADALTGNGLQICFAPGSKNAPRWIHKRWPYYKQLAELLTSEYPECSIYIIGTSEDQVDQTLLDAPNVKDLRDQLTLQETAWIFKNVDLAVGNDCGPMHIADAVGSNGITLFGPSCDLKNSPRNKITSLHTNLPCRPCQYNGPITCQNPKCIQKITPEMVIEAIKKQL